MTPAACVGVDHANIDADTCLLGTRGRGLCCPDNLRNNIVQLPAAEDEAAVSRVGFPEVTAAELDTLFDEAAREVETGVLNRRFHPGPSTGNQLPTEQGGAKKKTASFFHHKFNSPRKEIVNIDKEARKLVQVTRKLAELKNLTASQASTGLRAGFNLATSSRISQTCPWNNPVPVCSKNSKYRCRVVRSVLQILHQYSPLVRTDKYFVSSSTCNPTACSHWLTQSQKEDDIYYLFIIG